MKITFISQKAPSFIKRDDIHLPVDLAQQCALKAYNFHYSQLDALAEQNENFDIAILLIPKTGLFGTRPLKYGISVSFSHSIPSTDDNTL